MSATATPMGAEPVGGLSACGSFSGKVRHIKIASGYAANIFYGDFVKLVNTGTIEKDAGTATATPVGIFMGCFYTDPSTSQPTFNQMWPTGTVASDAMAYVLDDPDAVFRMQGDGSLAQTTLGNNIAIIQTSGSTTIGRSKNAVDASTAATTDTLPLRILEFMDGPDSTVGDAYTDVLLTYNFGMHQYRNATGI
tara:strand:+ start:1094 stop:1675 length:582 start_codon:yes stop_codon:yes gene_type:complete